MVLFCYKCVQKFHTGDQESHEYSTLFHFPSVSLTGPANQGTKTSLTGEIPPFIGAGKRKMNNMVGLLIESHQGFLCSLQL